MGDPYSGRPFTCPNCNALCDTITLHKGRCRKAAQIIIECIGADGPQSVEEAAMRIVAEVNRLRDEAKYPIHSVSVNALSEDTRNAIDILAEHTGKSLEDE